MDPKDEEDTKARVAYALRDIMQDGDRFLVSCKNGAVDVDPPPVDEKEEELSKTEPELYGHLMTLNQELSSAGTGLTFFFLIASVLISMAIGLGWLESLFDISTDSLESWWVYLLIVILGFMIGGALADGKSKDAFARAYGNLMSMASRAGFNRYTLLARIKDDKELSELVKYLGKEGAERGDR
jgi:hypothetical protein